MARFARIDSQIRADHLIRANRLRVPELNPFFCESRFGAVKNCESRVWGDSLEFESLGRYQNRVFLRIAVGMAELARVIAAIRITSARWRSHLSQKRRMWSLETLRSLCCDSSFASGVHWCSIRSMWTCGMACESWLCSLNASNWRLAILLI